MKLTEKKSETKKEYRYKRIEELKSKHNVARSFSAD